MKVGRWSTNAGNNNSTPPDGWPENQAPSTVNDCAREMMASIRTAFTDLQFVDQDWTPTYINANSFSVPGDQTSAMQVGRMLKLFDGGTEIYRPVATASYTTVTTISLGAGTSITTSLSSFGVSILTSQGMPKSYSSENINVQNLTIFGTFTASTLASTTLTVGAATVINTLSTGSAIIGGTLAVSASIVAQNVAKAFIRWDVLSLDNIVVASSFNIAALSRDSTGVYRVTFGTPFADANYTYFPVAITGAATPIGWLASGSGATLELQSANVNGTLVDVPTVCLTVYR